MDLFCCYINLKRFIDVINGFDEALIISSFDPVNAIFILHNIVRREQIVCAHRIISDRFALFAREIIEISQGVLGLRKNIGINSIQIAVE